jgi:acyl dehydratase
MKFFEDFHSGDVFELGQVTVTADEIKTFASQFDPQPFHVDEAAAEASPFGGLVASGLHTASLFMRRYVAVILADASGGGSPGIDRIRFLKTVRPGDLLSARLTVLSTRPLMGRPDFGLVEPECELLDSKSEPVLSMTIHSIFKRKQSAHQEA